MFQCTEASSSTYNDILLTYICSAFVGLDKKLYKMHGMYTKIWKMVFYRGHETSHSLFDNGKQDMCS
jgi:hypothetical protein